MKTPLSVIVAFLLFPLTAQADAGAAFEPYVFGGASAISNSGGQPHAGGGLDVIFGERLGAQAELGWAGSDYGIGLLSGDLLFRFLPRRATRVMPYVAAGFSTSAFRGPARGFANLAIGTDLNVGRKAIRIEVREHAGLSEFWKDRHIVGLRVGLVWARGD